MPRPKKPLLPCLSYLQCPTCKEGTLLQSRQGRSDLLECSILSCGATFPVRREIPRFVDEWDDGFDLRWVNHPKTQATTISAWEAKVPWSPGQLAGRVVLDAGCGIGRFTEVALQYGAAQVISLDLSPTAVEMTSQLNGDKAYCIQGDLLHIPLRDECVDSAFSIGVLHHTPNPKAAFMEVARTIKSGGQLAVWVYSPPMYDEATMAAAKLFYEITKACPPTKLYKVFKEYAVATRNAYKDAWNPLTQVIRVSTSKDDEECISDTFDWHVPRYRAWHSTEEVLEWFKEAGFSAAPTNPNMPTSVWGKKLK